MEPTNHPFRKENDLPNLHGITFHVNRVGGFNPSEKYESNWKSSPNRDEHKKCLSCHHLVIFRGVCVI